MQPYLNSSGYATDLFTQKTLDIIKKHSDNSLDPLFLILSHLAPHTGKDGTELEVSDIEENDAKFSYIEDKNRRLYAGLLDSLDQSLGDIVESLQTLGMLNNSIIMFLSDNGAQTVGMHQNYGSNWPLKGVSNVLTLFNTD